MFARPNAVHHQLAYLTNDIDGAIRMFAEEFGAPGFYFIPGTEERGVPARIALSRVGGIEIELIEPGPGAPALYRDVVSGDGPLALQFHHVAARIEGSIEDWEHHLASIDTAAHPIVHEGAIGDHLRFVYTDERSRLGHYVEHIWIAPEVRAQMAKIVPTYPPLS